MIPRIIDGGNQIYPNYLPFPGNPPSSPDRPANKNSPGGKQILSHRALLLARNERDGAGSHPISPLSYDPDSSHTRRGKRAAPGIHPRASRHKTGDPNMAITFRL